MRRVVAMAAVVASMLMLASAAFAAPYRVVWNATVSNREVQGLDVGPTTLDIVVDDSISAAVSGSTFTFANPGAGTFGGGNVSISRISYFSSTGRLNISGFWNGGSATFFVGLNQGGCSPAGNILSAIGSCSGAFNGGSGHVAAGLDEIANISVASGVPIITPVPEPTTALLLGLGLIPLSRLGREGRA